MGVTCKGTSENYLVLTNGLLVTLGLVIIGYAIYQLVEFGDLREGIGSFPILAPLVVGVVLLFVSALGVYGAKSKKKIILIVYFVVVFIITVFVLGSGVALLSYGGYLSEVRNGEIDGSIQQNILDFELAIFNKCCAEAGQGAPAQQCPLTDPCFTDADDFQFYLENIGDGVCEGLESVKINGVPLVGDNSTGACGGGDAGTFVDNISKYLQDNIVTLGSVNLAVAVIMLLIIIASCVLIFTGKSGDQKKKQQAKQGDGAPLVASQ